MHHLPLSLDLVRTAPQPEIAVSACPLSPALTERGQRARLLRMTSETSDMVLINDLHAEDGLQAPARDLHDAEENKAPEGHVHAVVLERLATLVGRDSQLAPSTSG